MSLQNPQSLHFFFTWKLTRFLVKTQTKRGQLTNRKLKVFLCGAYFNRNSDEFHRTMNEFTARVKDRMHVLSTINHNIGIPDDAAEEQHRRLFGRMIDVVEDQIETSTKEYHNVLRAIENMKASIVEYKRLMGDTILEDQESPKEKPEKSLLETLEDVKKVHEEVEQDYHVLLNKIKAEMYPELHAFTECMHDFVNTTLIDAEKPDVSPAAYVAIKAEIQRCQVERELRLKQAEKYFLKLGHLWTLLEITPTEERDCEIYHMDHAALHEEKIPVLSKYISLQGLEYLRQKVLELEEIKDEREFRKQEILQVIYRLWDRLKIPPDERQAFLDAHIGYSLSDIKEHEHELKRLTRLKEDHIDTFILSAREDLARLWDKLYWSEEERRQFSPAFTNEFSDEVLEAHEAEIVRLNGIIDDLKYVLDAVDRHMKLAREVKEFDITTNDPLRLFGKGDRDPGRLLREEKYRTRLSKEVPRIEKELKAALDKYESINGRPFCVNGVPYVGGIRFGEGIAMVHRQPFGTNSGVGANSDHYPTTPTREHHATSRGLRSSAEASKVVRQSRRDARAPYNAADCPRFNTRSREQRTPNRDPRTPSREAHTPLRDKETGIQQHVTPLPGRYSPSRRCDTPSRQRDTPSRLYGTPSRHPGTPSRHIKTPSRQTDTPSCVRGTPSRQPHDNTYSSCRSPSARKAIQTSTPRSPSTRRLRFQYPVASQSDDEQDSESILDLVRSENIRRRAVRRLRSGHADAKHSGTTALTSPQNENAAPLEPIESNATTVDKHEKDHNPFPLRSDVDLDLDIFDDGPELSDMSEKE